MEGETTYRRNRRIRKRTAVEETMRGLLDQDGYGPDGVRYVSDEDMPHCKNCSSISFNLKPLDGDETVMASATCRDEDYQVIVQAAQNGEEPECTCDLMGNGDLFNPMSCELHNDDSRWNVVRRSVTTVQEYERAMDREVA